MRLSYCSLIIISLLAGFPAGAASAPASSGSSYNFTLILLVSLAVVFAFAIALLAYVLKHLSLAYMDKWRKDKAAGRAIKSIALLLVAVLPAFSAMAEETAAPEVMSPFINGIPRGDFYFISGVLAFEVMILLILLWQIFRMSAMLRDVPEKAPVPSLLFRKNLLDVFNKSVAVKDEAGITMDHEYDGIRELDNDLPPWWKWGFVMTVIFSVIYLGYYHAAGGPNQAEEFRIAMERAEVEKAEYLAKAANNVDENSVTMVKDEVEISSAKNIFETTCAACHAKDGGGTVGPNLTDDYWLHGGDIKSVFKSVKYGWPDKGMKSWKDDYSPKQIAALASYIKTLKGTKPAAPKAPQGELFSEGASIAAATAETTVK